AADALAPVHAELVRSAADGDVQHIDDTSMKVLGLGAEERKEVLGKAADRRTGTFTSGIVSKRRDGRTVALFFTGPQHAGENIASVLAHRSKALAPPIQMSDALAANTSADFERIAAACLVHARRNFVDVVGSFPDECALVLT